MELFDVFVQGISIIAMIAMILSYQCKTQKSILLMQLVGEVLFAIHFLLLKAYVGCILNVVGILRAGVFYNRKKFHAEHPGWVALFSLLFFGAYVLNFNVFGADPIVKNFIVELLPVIGMIAATIGMCIGSARSTRFSFLICSPSWLIYNCFSFSIGGIICEVISLCSIFIGIYRYDIKKKAE